jgi:hypothetical protein
MCFTHVRHAPSVTCLALRYQPGIVSAAFNPHSTLGPTIALVAMVA